MQHKTSKRLERAIAINLVIAWRIMLMTLLGRECPDLPAEVLFSDPEIEVLQAYAKKRIKQLKLSGQGRVRINKAGCLDRCDEGPIIVVYPEEVWYTYQTEADIDEIIDSHIVGGNPVARLRI